MHRIPITIVGDDMHHAIVRQDEALRTWHATVRDTNLVQQLGLQFRGQIHIRSMRIQPDQVADADSLVSCSVGIESTIISQPRIMVRRHFTGMLRS